LQKDKEIARHEREIHQRESEITEVRRELEKSDLHADGSPTHCRTQSRDGGRAKKSEVRCSG
jgi:hypothetical protein